MKTLAKLFENNRSWAEQIKARRPDFFEQLARQQAPDYLFIGCSDSRLPPNEVLGLLPGELFVHRNVGNIVVHTDFNCLSVLEYAVAVLGVEHVIICGHYGCGGVEAALGSLELGLIDNWLRHIRDVHERHRPLLEMLPEGAIRRDRLCELNVLEQVRNACNTSIVQAAWRRGKQLSVHGWIYRLMDGLLRDLGVCVNSAEEVHPAYSAAINVLYEEDQ